MSRSLNKIMLIGNVGGDPEIRATSSGTRVAKFSLATNRQWKDSSGQQHDKTEWHRITLFGKLADIVEQWVNKGDRIYVEGRLEYSQSEKEGQVRYWTDIIVTELLMLGSGGSGEGSASTPTPIPTPTTAISEPDDDLPF